MLITELREACRDGDYVVLHLTPPNSRGYTRRLCGRNGPRGEIISGNSKGQTVRFESQAVVRFLDKDQASLAIEGSES